MSFLFGRTSRPALNKKESLSFNEDDSVASDFVDYGELREPYIGSYQPDNPFKDLIILPQFDSEITFICILDDLKRFVTGDVNGNLIVWDSDDGSKLAELRFHQKAINGIVEYKNTFSSILNKTVNTLIVSSNDAKLSAWNLDDTYARINTAQLASNSSMRIFLNLSASNTKSTGFFIVAGLDLKLYDSNLALIDEFSRNTRDNSIKLMSLVKHDRFVLATNSDLEVYALVVHVRTNLPTETKIKLFTKFPNVHLDSILCLDYVSDGFFASGSSDGHLILWQVDSLARTLDLRPFDELNKSETALRLSSTSIVSFKLLNQRYLLICSGFNISIYDLIANEYACNVPNAHNKSKITDVLLLNGQIVATSAENGSIRVWRFQENSNVNERHLEIKLELIGECLGHSASVTSVKTVSKNEIVSFGFDNMIIIWRNADVINSERSVFLDKIFFTMSSLN